jgi:PKD repeat protein
MTPRLRSLGGAPAWVVPLLAVLLASALAPPAATAKAVPARVVSARIVALAQGELSRGVREVPWGSNRGARIAMYGRSTQPHFYPAPWCAYFASWVTREAGVPIGPAGRGEGYVPYIRAWARSTGRWTRRPKPGRLIVFPQHVGIVESVDAGAHTLTTIEGNSGNAVRRRWRRWSEAMGYVRTVTGPVADTVGGGRRPPAPAGPPSPLRARITAYPGTVVAIGQRVDFTAQDTTGQIVAAAWDLDGDGRFETRGDSASRSFATAGRHAVALRVTGTRGRVSTARATILVRANRPPVARLVLSATQVHPGETLRGDASGSSDPDGRIVRYEWDLNGDHRFGDDGAVHSASFDEPGDYHVTVRVTDDRGATAEAGADVHVADWPQPVSRLECSPTSLVSGQTVTCHADDSGSPTHIVRHEWDLNDDGSYGAGGTDRSMTYKTPGDYTAHLRVTDEHGHVAETGVDLHVANRPPAIRVVASAAQIDMAGRATLTAQASDPDGRVADIAWDLDGDGVADAHGAQVVVTPKLPGAIVVRATAVDDLGATASASTTITAVDAPPAPKLVLPVTRAVAGRPVTLTASGADADGTIASWDWDFDGDGTWDRTTTAADPPAQPWTYGAAGRYTVRLRATDAFGLSAVTSTVLTVYSG